MKALLERTKNPEQINLPGNPGNGETSKVAGQRVGEDRGRKSQAEARVLENGCEKGKGVIKRDEMGKKLKTKQNKKIRMAGWPQPQGAGG